MGVHPMEMRLPWTSRLSYLSAWRWDMTLTNWFPEQQTGCWHSSERESHLTATMLLNQWYSRQKINAHPTRPVVPCKSIPSRFRIEAMSPLLGCIENTPESMGIIQCANLLTSWTLLQHIPLFSPQLVAASRGRAKRVAVIRRVNIIYDYGKMKESGFAGLTLRGVSFWLLKCCSHSGP